MLIDSEFDKLLMIPGPTPVQREILAAMSKPTISHTSAAMAPVVTTCLDGVRSLCGSTSGQPFIFGGAGTLAQEAAIVNLVEPGERLVVASNGFFGDRFVPMARAHGIEVDHLTAAWGESVTAEQLRERLSGRQVRAVTITQVETSTGVLAPVAELAAVAREADALVIVDAVCGLGGVPVEMDRDGIDIVLSGAQKALGVPPGLAILLASERAMSRRREITQINAYYADLLNWLASMKDPETYFSTHAVNLFYGLRVAFGIIEREGAPRFVRHCRLATAFRAGINALGFNSLTREPWLAPTMSVMAYPDGVDDAEFRAALSARGVIAAACLGPFKGKGLRFGHMGNISSVEILQGVSAASKALVDLGVGTPAGSGVEAAQEILVAG